MIKFIAVLFSVLLAFTQVVEAKYKNPEGRSKSIQTTNRYFNILNDSKDGEMTLEQYKARDLTRNDRRNMRKDKKNGVYISDEERFNAMDIDADGVVTKEEMQTYIKGINQEERSFY